jgi:hypothetical protein
MTLRLDSFDEGSKKKSNTKYKAALGVGSVVSLFGIGSTLAANISLNGGGNVEFGQGVATTAACDEDGFNITPVTSFDNELAIFKVDYVQVSGLNLTPEGNGWAESGDVVDQNGLGGINLTDAKLQFPGQYYDGTDWKSTCDGVVLDFKAYTDDDEFLLYTDDAFNNAGPGSKTSPVFWTQDIELVDGVAEWDGGENPGFAVVFDSYANNEKAAYDDDESGYRYNFAVDAVDKTWNQDGYPNWHSNINPMFVGVNQESIRTSNAQFSFGGTYKQPNAASISKITVQSMKEFPNSYYAYTVNNSSYWVKDDLGNPSSDWFIT